MTLIYYSTTDDVAGKWLLSIVRSVILKEQIEFYQSIDTLSQRLQRLMFGIKIVVIFAVSKKDIHKLIETHPLLCDIRIILVLPDREEDTISKGLKLHPRFFTYAGYNFNDVKAVLEKVLIHLNLQQTQQIGILQLSNNHK